MQRLSIRLITAGITFALLTSPVYAKEKKSSTPTAWCVAINNSVEVREKPGDRKKVMLRLGRGALVPVFEVKQPGSRNWARVRAVDPAQLLPEFGWVDSDPVES